MSHTGKLLLVALSAVVLAGGTAAQVPDSAVSVCGTLGSIGQSSTNTGPFKFDNSQPGLSLAARIERGKALPKYEGPLASPEWLRLNCTATYEPGRRSAVSRDQCIEQLAAAMPAFDPSKPRHFGERYSPQTWRDCRLHAHDFGGAQGHPPIACDQYKLRRIENPTFWPYEHNKDFKWPEPPKEAVYRLGMTPEVYHKALCEKESGQWVYKKVEGVKSIYLVRPYRTSIGQDYQRDRFVEEGPFMVNGHLFAGPQSLTSNLFDFVEAMFEKGVEVGRQGSLRSNWLAGSRDRIEPDLFIPTSDQYFLAKLSRHKLFVRSPDRPYEQDPRPIVVEAIPRVSSQIGLVWRDIERFEDRENAIAGTEAALVDLHSNELLSLYRTFSLMGRGWGSSRLCEVYTRDPRTLRDFITSTISTTK